MENNLQNNVFSEKLELNQRIESIGWGLFLVMIGGIWLVPDRFVPQGTWLVGAGLILLGLNVARYIKGIRMSGFTLFLGAVALLSGAADFLRVDLPLMPIFLILIGANIILKPMIEKYPKLSE
ncbi:MAG: hypothetical protein CVU39_26595 [Chloroflexi bacterium HGW-Chloroflexi-10]|nr:MAG: hypothetical protein CVU39_26595 [Chloroflexi bacterium HGW-Chloroflexi-10]